MKNTWRIVRARWYLGSFTTSQNIVLSRCLSPSQIARYSTVKSSDTIGGENYFKQLSNILHNDVDSSVVEPVKHSRVKKTAGLAIVKSSKNDELALESLDDNGDFVPLAEIELKSEDVPKITPVSFNLAAYANKSETIQQLVKLGADLSKWEKDQEVADFIIKADFEKDLKDHIKFLHDVGVPANSLGKLLTKNPKIFKIEIEDLQVRINYLESKKFSREAIGRIVEKAPHFLMFSTEAIDKRLGYLQKEYKLTGDEVRCIVTRQPKIAIWNFLKLRDKLFAMKEEMGFKPEEVKTMLIASPKLWLLEHRSLVERFNYIHLTLKVPQNLIAQFSRCLQCRRLVVKQRHLFLKAINRDQYDPIKECYVSLHALTTGSDTDFCTTVAKTSVKKFNEFLKTL